MFAVSVTGACDLTRVCDVHILGIQHHCPGCIQRVRCWGWVVVVGRPRGEASDLPVDARGERDSRRVHEHAVVAVVAHEEVVVGIQRQTARLPQTAGRDSAEVDAVLRKALRVPRGHGHGGTDGNRLGSGERLQGRDGFSGLTVHARSGGGSVEEVKCTVVASIHRVHATSGIHRDSERVVEAAGRHSTQVGCA